MFKHSKNSKTFKLFKEYYNKLDFNFSFQIVYTAMKMYLFIPSDLKLYEITAGEE